MAKRLTKNAKVVAEFLDDFIRALRGDERLQQSVAVHELKEEKHARVADRWFDRVTGYRTTFCDISVWVSTERREVFLDRRKIGEDVLSGTFPGALMDRYAILRDDIAERYVMQEADREAALREIRKLAVEGNQELEYADLAKKVRAKKPKTIACGRKRSGARGTVKR